VKRAQQLGTRSVDCERRAREGGCFLGERRVQRAAAQARNVDEHLALQLDQPSS